MVRVHCWCGRLPFKQALGFDSRADYFPVSGHFPMPETTVRQEIVITYLRVREGVLQ